MSDIPEALRPEYFFDLELMEYSELFEGACCVWEVMKSDGRVRRYRVIAVFERDVLSESDRDHERRDVVTRGRGLIKDDPCDPSTIGIPQIDLVRGTTR